MHRPAALATHRECIHYAQAGKSEPSSAQHFCSPFSQHQATAVCGTGMHREKKTLTLQTGGCSLPSATSASSAAVVDREASSGCCDQAASVQMASNDSPTNVDCSKCLYKSTTTTTTNTTTATSSSTIAASNGSSSCASRQPPKQPSTPPPLISPSRALGNGFSGPTPPRVLYGLGHHSNAPQANSPYLPLHTAPYSSIGVASPPSPRCYDIIEEEMIFPMSDITEEDEVLIFCISTFLTCKAPLICSFS